MIFSLAKSADVASKSAKLDDVAADVGYDLVKKINIRYVL